MKFKFRNVITVVLAGRDGGLSGDQLTPHQQAHHLSNHGRGLLGRQQGDPTPEAIPKWRRAMENKVRWLPNVKCTWKLLPMEITYAIAPEIAERSRRQRMLDHERKSSGTSHNVSTNLQVPLGPAAATWEPPRLIKQYGVLATLGDWTLWHYPSHQPYNVRARNWINNLQTLLSKSLSPSSTGSIPLSSSSTHSCCNYERQKKRFGCDYNCNLVCAHIYACGSCCEDLPDYHHDRVICRPQTKKTGDCPSLVAVPIASVTRAQQDSQMHATSLIYYCRCKVVYPCYRR